jgi:hypothetical protein
MEKLLKGRRGVFFATVSNKRKVVEVEVDKRKGGAHGTAMTA